ADKYDKIIFGFPVWASCPAPPIKSFIKENLESISKKEFSVFTCYMGGGAEKAIAKLKNYLFISEFKAELILIDPKDKPTKENDRKTEEFISKLIK
ncbi:MAG: flavodoxin, partial [Ruminococcus sp.]|nr:flavodoxin [Ruminococcus sp.]